jgi:hypothetical protein
LRKRITLVTLMLGASCGLIFAARSRPLHAVPTFNREVVRIFQQQCQSCHRPGGVAPFSLTTYDSAYEQRWLIAGQTATRKMPPWKPADGCGEFKAQRKLTDQQIITLAAWVRAGAPEGEPADLPPPLDFNDGWSLGEPDLVLEMPEVYTPPTNVDSFRLFPLPYVFPRDTYISAVDLQPGAREYVHHSLVHVDSSGQSDILDAADPQPGYDYMRVGIGFEASGFLGTWVPGQPPQAVPDGSSLKIPAGGKIVLEIHYHPHDGVIRSDRTKIGLYLTRKPIRKLQQFAAINNPDFVIPAGASNHQITATWTIDRPMHLLAVGAHMHYIGRRMTVTATLPEGGERCLLTVNDWDPAWQGLYDLRESIALPAGTTLRVDGYYDNSSANERNPFSPPRDVKSGGLATDEMCIAYLTYTWDDDVVEIDPSQ